VLLANTVRSSTLKLALISIGIFGAPVVALLSYVYWSTASYVQYRLDRDIEAERVILQRVYDRAGRNALAAAIARRIAEERLDACAAERQTRSGTRARLRSSPTPASVPTSSAPRLSLLRLGSDQHRRHQGPRSLPANG